MCCPAHLSVLQYDGAQFTCHSVRLHNAAPWQRLIYIFDYCPASWHVPLIDGHCVPIATSLLLSPAQNSLKDRSTGALVTLFHFSCPSPLYHSFSFPFTTLYQFLPLSYLLFSTHASLCRTPYFTFSVLFLMQIQVATFTSLISMTGVRLCSVCMGAVCVTGEWVKMKGKGTLCTAWVSPLLGDLAFISSDLTHTVE